MTFDIHARILNNSSENFGYRAIEGVEGIELAQIAIVAVREGSEPEREYICVNCAAVQPTPRQCRLLAAALKPVFTGATVAILKWEGRPGVEDAYLAPGQSGTPTGCAAAFSLYKMCWGWDESPTFAIGVNGEEVVLCVGDAQDGYRSFRHVARLGRKDALNGLANSMLNFFMSRDHDFLGYWAIGRYHRAVGTFPEKKIVVDFLEGVVTPETEIGSEMGSKYAGWYWKMLNSRGIPSAWIRSATVSCTFEVEKPGDPRRRWYGGVGGFYDCVAEVVDRRGKIYRLARDGWSWPHDPTRELRRGI